MPDARGGFPGFGSGQKLPVVDGVMHVLIDEERQPKVSIAVATLNPLANVKKQIESRLLTQAEFDGLRQDVKDALKKSGSAQVSIPSFLQRH